MVAPSFCDPVRLYNARSYCCHNSVGAVQTPQRALAPCARRRLADFWGHLWMDGSFFTQLGQRVPWEGGAPFHSAESGQVLFDRLRHYDVLEWLFWLNSHSDVTYQHMHGDKDTYRLAFSLAGVAGCAPTSTVLQRDVAATHNSLPGGRQPAL
eukprot:GHRQ01033290.1.p1 GENE.GHRQ01033290.1~~GHRQ01033290.1.p1  ORF type:complete len:153 (+),score=29.45 GHRQ01033290.1:489-947(+)